MSSLFRVEHLQQGASDQDCMNRYWYYNPGSATVTAAGVGLAFGNTLGAALKAIQSVEWTQAAVAVTEVLSGVDTALITLVNGAGIQSGDCRASYDTFSYYVKPVGPILKRGGKRIGGIPEGQCDDDEANTDFVDNLAAFAAILNAALVVSGTDVFPAIVRGSSEAGWIISPLVAALYRQLSTCRSRLLSRSGGGGGLLRLAYREEDELELPSLTEITTNAEGVTAINSIRATMGEVYEGSEVVIAP